MTDAPTDLPQRLGALADLGTVDATAPGPGDAAAAWQRGVRYRRRQRLGTATIAAMTVALLTGIAGFSAVRGESTIQPAGSQAPAGLPNRFYAPSTWLPSTSDASPSVSSRRSSRLSVAHGGARRGARRHLGHDRGVPLPRPAGLGRGLRGASPGRPAGGVLDDRADYGHA